VIPVKKETLPGAHPRLQGEWGYIDGLEPPTWHPYHSEQWWKDEYQRGWEHEKFLDEQRKGL